MEPGPSTETSKPLIARDDNENLAIGKNRFTIEAVCESLTNCNSTGILWDKLLEFARNLGLPENRLILINTSLTLENKTNYAVLHEILSEWKNMETTQATLHTLTSALENTKELQLYADSLRKQFSTETTDSNENVIQVGSLNDSDPNNRVQSDGPETHYYIDDAFAGSTTALLSGDPYQFEDNAATRRMLTLRNIFLRFAPAVYLFLTFVSLGIWVLIAFVSEHSNKVEHI